MSDAPIDPFADSWEPLESLPRLESVRIFGVDVRPGHQVRLWPQHTADIIDLALAGRMATVESIERDYDGKTHLAVVVDDDPGRDLGMLRQPGHRFFFSPDEVEPVALDGQGTS